MKMEGLEMKVQYWTQVKATLSEQKEKVNMNKSTHKERSELNKHQMVSTDVMSSLMKVTSAMKENKQV